MKCATVFVCLVLFVPIKNFGQFVSKNTSCINWTTFFGGNSNDEIKGLVKNSQGEILVCGETDSKNFAVTPGLISDSIKGDADAFVAKFDSCGNLFWSTLLGSSFYDAAEKIICDSAGSIFICGSTLGSDFPVTAGAWQNSSGGSFDSFLAKINSSGNLLWCTYFGMSGADFAYDLAEDKNGNIYIGGSTNSANLPTVGQSAQQNIGGANDAYVASFSSAGNFRWCTYFGGNATEDVHVLRADKFGDIYIAGGTFSQNIVMGANAFQQFHNGGMDVYVLKMDSLGNKLWSTYLGDTGLDDCYALGTDSAANVYLSGLTYSTDFPVTPGCFQDTLSQYSDLYLAKFSANGDLMWSTFLGGTDLDDCKSLCVNSNQEITLLGRTMSADIPLAGSPAQNTPAGNYDLFLARFDSAGVFFYGSYLGGSNEEIPTSIISFGENKCIIAGGSYSADLPVTAGAYQTNLDSLKDGMLSKFDFPSSPTLHVQNTANSRSVVSAFPNPAKDFCTISSDEKITGIKIYDAQGKLLQHLKCATEETGIDLTFFNKGLLLLEITNETATVRRKIIHN
jgi:hypothetical protein